MFKSLFEVYSSKQLHDSQCPQKEAGCQEDSSGFGVIKGIINSSKRKGHCQDL